ncbi:MAG TPA: hypothetical protein VNM38_01445, partial [Solirubrobacterales bacterium]|nr:hypothetical protein [Solirubrobacterales bacterium]
MKYKRNASASVALVRLNTYFVVFALVFTGMLCHVDGAAAEQPSAVNMWLKGLAAGAHLPEWARDMHIHFLAPPGEPEYEAPTEEISEEGGESAGAVEEAADHSSAYSPQFANSLAGSEPSPYRFNGGWVQHRPHVHVIFWGSEWSSHPSERTAVLEMFRWINGSSYAAILTQYFDQSGYIGNEVDLSSYTDSRAAHPSNVTVGSLEQEISYSIGSQAGWSPSSPDDQYMVITSPGTTYDPALGANSCGFHAYPNNSFGAPFSFIPWPAGEFAACRGWSTTAGSIQAVASHEWVETVTDPIPPASLNGALVGWFRENASLEIADGCGATEPASAPAGVVVERLHDNYLAAAVEQSCTAQDASPIRYGVHTNGVTQVSAGSRSAVLRGEVTPSGYPATYQFNITGPTGSLFLPSSPAGAGSGFAPVTLSQTLTGLKGQTTYSYSLRSTSQMTESLFNGKTSVISGGVETFTTPDWRPAVSYQPASSRTQTSATLNAKVNPQGEASTYHFEW